jgi:hypothetical protein
VIRQWRADVVSTPVRVVRYSNIRSHFVTVSNSTKMESMVPSYGKPILAQRSIDVMTRRDGSLSCGFVRASAPGGEGAIRREDRPIVCAPSDAALAEPRRPAHRQF